MKKASINPQSNIKSLAELKNCIKSWGQELGFDDVGITDTNLSQYEPFFWEWIQQDFHGDMDYMVRHGNKRTQPTLLESETVSIISVRINYYDPQAMHPAQVLHNSEKAYISRYALGKDYHKLVRKRLQKLADKINQEVDNFAFRAFTDSAPVLEGPIAEKAGLGFIGKNSLNIHPKAGSWFFLGELFCNLNLPADKPFEKQGCGPCTACIQECPTQAIVANGVVDARRCISYLTIEFKGIIPEEFRQPMGNRIYGCDDCQLVCPWNKFTQKTQELAFKNTNSLDNPNLLELWQWQEKQFLTYFEGSPIRRIGYEQWQRNLAIAIGNMTGPKEILNQGIEMLKQRQAGATELLKPHIEWAMTQLQQTVEEYSSKIPLHTYKKTIEIPASQIKPFKAKKYYLIDDLNK